MSKKLKIFISHHHNDAQKLGKIKKSLQEYDVECFVAHEDIEPGEHDLKRIQNELTECDIFLLIGDVTTQSSIFVNQEIGFALGKGKPIISTIKKDCSTWGFIARQQAITYEDIEEAIFSNKLVMQIANLAEENHYLSKKKNALQSLKVKSILINPQNKNNWHIETTEHDDYGFKTHSCLNNGLKTIAHINMAHEKFPDNNEPTRRKNFPNNNNRISAFLPSNEFSFLDKKFFSRILFEEGTNICPEVREAIQCLFNDIEKYPEIAKKYSKKSVTRVSLFRDEGQKYEKFLGTIK